MRVCSASCTDSLTCSASTTTTTPLQAMKARGADNTDLGEMAEAMLAKKRREQQ